MSKSGHVVLEHLGRFMRTGVGPHADILARAFKYIHRSQVRIPGQAPRIVSVPTDLHSVKDGWLYFPSGFESRAMDLLAKAGIPAVVKRLYPAPAHVAVDPNTPGLRPGQLEVLDTIAKTDVGIVHALTGFGKGVLVSKVIQLYPKERHLVCTKSRSVAQQLHARLKKEFPRAGLWMSGSSKDKRLDANPLVVTSGSLGHLELDQYTVVQLDEVHELLTPTFLEHYPRMGNCKLISYSASPEDRLDNTALAMEAYFGPIVSTVGYDEGVDLGLVVPIEVLLIKWGTYTGDMIGNFKSDVRRHRTAYWANHERNNMIARVVEEVIPERLEDPDPQILILVDKIEHALHLAKRLPDFKVVYGNMDKDAAEDFKSQGLLNEEPLTKKQMDEIRRDFSSGKIRRAIATGVWSTGVDFPGLSVIIRADGGASAIKDTQMPGRVCRIHGDKEVGILVDFADEFDHWSARRSRSRVDNYKDKGWKIEEVRM